MPSILLPRRFTSQPQGAVQIDWSNPITKDLSFVWGAANPGAEIVTGAKGFGYTTYPTIQTTVGISGKCARASSNSVISFSAAPIKASSAYTLLAFIVDDYGGGSIRNFFDADNQNYTRTFQFRCNTSSKADFIAFNTAGSAFTVTTSSNISISTASCIVGVANGNALSIYLNGRLDATAASTGTIRPINSANALTIGGRISGGSLTNMFGGQIYLIAHFARALNASEIARLSANPWQLFKVAE